MVGLEGFVKRGAELERRTLLRSSSSPKRRKPLQKRYKSKINREAAEAWAYGIRAKTCAVCGKRCGTVQGHHVLYQAWLREAARSRELDFDRLRWDPRNRLPVGEGCHNAHHQARRRIPLQTLRDHCPKVFQMARELGLLGRLERTYPDERDLVGRRAYGQREETE